MTNLSSAVVQSLKAVPNIVVSYNGPQYSLDELHKFALAWEFKHITTSTRYPTSNGKAESAIKIHKTLTFEVATGLQVRSLLGTIGPSEYTH